MNHITPLYDDYEIHRRRNLNQDELESLVARLPVSKPISTNRFLDFVGDSLISAGNSIKKYRGNHPATMLTHVRGDV